MRNVIFKVVPKSLIDAIYLEAKKKAVGDASTLTDRRTQALEYFAKMGIFEQRILSAIGKKTVAEIGLHELEILTGVRTAIKEGDAKIDEIFPELETSAGFLPPSSGFGARDHARLHQLSCGRAVGEHQLIGDDVFNVEQRR